MYICVVVNNNVEESHSCVWDERMGSQIPGVTANQNKKTYLLNVPPIFRLNGGVGKINHWDQEIMCQVHVLPENQRGWQREKSPEQWFCPMKILS